MRVWWYHINEIIPINPITVYLQDDSSFERNIFPIIGMQFQHNNKLYEVVEAACDNTIVWAELVE